MANPTFLKYQTKRTHHIIQNFSQNHSKSIQLSYLNQETQLSPRFDKLHWFLKIQEKTHRVWLESFQRGQSK